nr:uncharacterized protein LOC124812795 [Hydra vulgaris]
MAYACLLFASCLDPSTIIIDFLRFLESTRSTIEPSSSGTVVPTLTATSVLLSSASSGPPSAGTIVLSSSASSGPPSAGTIVLSSSASSGPCTSSTIVSCPSATTVPPAQPSAELTYEAYKIYTQHPGPTSNKSYLRIMGPKNSGSVFPDAVKHYLAGNFNLRNKIFTHCKNGHVILSFTNNSESVGKTLKQVNELFNLNISKRQLYNDLNVAKKFTSNYARDYSKFNDFCNQTTTYHSSSVPMNQEIQLNQSTSSTVNSESFLPSLHENIAILPLVNNKIWSLKASAELPKKKKIRVIKDNSEDDVDFQKELQISGLHGTEKTLLIYIHIINCIREIESIADVVEVDHSDLIDDHHVLLRMTKADIIKVYDKPQSNDFYKTRSSKNSRSSLLAIALVGERLMTGEITLEFWRDEEVKLQESSFLLDLYSDIEWEGIRWILKNMHNKYKQNKNSNFSNFVAEARSIMRALRSTQGK